MRLSNNVKPGWFFRNGRQYLAVSEVPRAMDLPAHQITDAIARGELRIERVSGCKVVELAEMMNYIDLLEGKK
ncbi:hypothetical protein [Marinobacter nauticus]|uniref:hypothetical protein n=1 Tax=Marinobacter nauticus TaxID=2743 RepID=UPI001C9A25F2|nr:hypothetical protein [Marinobacter nauticus]MBY5961717.1 hypothetical protein [Marinobacter nauticus]